MTEQSLPGTSYLIWNSTKPKREDAPKLRRMWAELRKRGRYDYNFRRRIAHDYAVAKCAKPVVTPAQARITARQVWPGEGSPGGIGKA